MGCEVLENIQVCLHKEKKDVGEFSGLINPNRNILKEVSGRVGRENIRRERKVHVA